MEFILRFCNCVLKIEMGIQLNILKEYKTVLATATIPGFSVEILQ